VIRLGVIGCGGFGLFALQHFAQLPGVQPVAMAGTHREAALAAARRFGMPDIQEVETLLSRDDVDLIYIATPPFLHYEQSLAALSHGKHVICEKPLAVTVQQADALLAASRQRDLLLATNLMQRYNPLFDAVKALLERQTLGALLHGYFENYAADEGLGPQHWFWDRSKSGGIFIEHGVHFFDLFAGWLGPGKVVSAQVSTRPGSGFEDQVQCAVRYRDGIVVNFYHGFHQASRMDRQELRLVFERGDVLLEEWIPTRFRIHALADEAQTRELCEIFPGARLDVTAVYGGQDRHCRGRQHDYDVYQMLELNGGHEPKMHRYGDLLRAMLADQLAWIENHSHPRRITEQNGRNSLAVAVDATRLAHEQGPGARGQGSGG
jgi:predicted dehydrogenase